MAAIYPFKMTEKKDEFLQVRGRELPIDAMEGMRHGVGDRVGKKVFLEIKNIFAGRLNVSMLSLGDSPNQDGNPAFIIRKVRADLLAKDYIRHVRDLQATLNCVLIRERHIPHSGGTKFFVDVAGMGKTGGKIQASQHPIGRPLAMAGVNMQISAMVWLFHGWFFPAFNHC